MAHFGPMQLNTLSPSATLWCLMSKRTDCWPHRVSKALAAPAQPERCLFARRFFRLFGTGLLALVAACGKGESAVEQAVLFSAVEGQVIKGGQPMAGARLIREWVFAADKVRGSDTATTDINGRFAFAAVVHPYRKPFFFAQEMFIEQLIRVEATGVEWRVWTGSKRDIKPGTEAAVDYFQDWATESPLRVTIDLDSTLIRPCRCAVV